VTQSLCGKFSGVDKYRPSDPKEKIHMEYDRRLGRRGTLQGADVVHNTY
jgi:hypothetical protein